MCTLVLSGVSATPLGVNTTTYGCPRYVLGFERMNVALDSPAQPHPHHGVRYSCIKFKLVLSLARVASLYSMRMVFSAQAETKQDGEYIVPELADLAACACIIDNRVEGKDWKLPISTINKYYLCLY